MSTTVTATTTDAPAPHAVTHRASASTFPAGTSLALLGVWFVLARVLVPFTATHLAAARIAMLAGSGGAVLAAVACLLAVFDGPRARQGMAMSVALVRAVVVLPVALLVGAALYFQTLPAAVQWAGLAGALGSVAVSLALGIYHARRGMTAAGASMAALLVGECIELVSTPAVVMTTPDSPSLHLLGRLGALSELCALFGAALALLWAVRASLRSAGATRTKLFAPLPAFSAVVLSLVAASIPQHIAAAVARTAFGARFDLFVSPEHPMAITLPVLLVYLLVPEMLLGAAAMSMAGVQLDRGASIRRTFGWLAVLLAGFSALRLAGPMDPIRLVTVTLGAILLERAAAFESDDRAAA